MSIILSWLDLPKSISSSSYNLSPKIQRLSLSNRFYSTSSVDKNILDVDNLDQIESIKFDSLEQGCEEIKFKYLGVSGVYKLINKNDPNLFYIGSSNNLSRRMEEYNKLTKGLRKPHSSSELEISKTSALNWKLEFLYITTPQTSLVYEQYAILKFKPAINSNLSVIPRINPQWGNNLNNAIATIEKLLSLFTEGSEGYNRINVFLKTFKLANGLDYTPEDADNKYYCFLVFVYNITSPHGRPVVYSSINRALKGLQISHSTLLNYINNKYLFNSNLVLSFESLVEEDFAEYQERPTGDSQLRKHIVVYNQDNERVAEFKSGREMARYFQIDGKVARLAIAKGEYLDFLLVSKDVSFRQTIYVFDSDTKEILAKFLGVSKALKYAKVNFYTLKSLIEKGNSYNGKIYSYKDKI
uniref:GIY-YIG endonuclease n=1 Tax=Fusarium culmorum TaxID=5516 RepID=A0A6G6B1K2_FUSCU|nr:GIY-YIG endonuclease [Fusarium culmorum]